jgi:hypothetical protein
MAKYVMLIIGLLVLMASIVLFDCAPGELEGTLKPNNAPTISFTNLPLEDSTYTSSPTIYWYGFDSDGIIDAYYYKIVVADSMGGIEADEYLISVMDTLSLSEWVMTDSTRVTVLLYADEDTSVALQQYIYVKCQDDAGDFSETIYMSLFRKNHPPETYLYLLPGNYADTVGELVNIYTLPVWSLPDTNALWQGFNVSWSADDTIDFPNDQPDFEFAWRLYGPYPDSLYIDINEVSPTYPVADSIYLSLSDTAGYLSMMSCNNAAGYIVYTGEPCEDPWVWQERGTFGGLPTGCYIFAVQARDDALVPDTTVAWGTFVCLQPIWISEPDSAKDILVIQATQYRAFTFPFNGYPYYSNSDSSAIYPDSIEAFYTQMIEGAGFSSDDYYIYPGPENPFSTIPNYPTISELAYYKMIIFDDMDYDKMELANEFDAYQPYIPYIRDYLSIGGKIWVIGRQSFLAAGANFSGYQDFSGGSLAVDFFDLSGAYYTEWNRFDPNGEFQGAASTSSGFGNLVIDSLRTSQLRHYGLNKVESLVRNSNLSRTLYTYEAFQPDTMVNFQYSPCAVRFTPQHGVFKTSYFSFPLYMMDNSNGQVQAVFSEMLNWFLNEN